MSDETTWRERLESGGVRTGTDPRWKRLGNVSEMGLMPPASFTAWLAERVPVRLVPGEYWSLDAVDTGETKIDRVSGTNEPVIVSVALVACPCGHQPTVPALDHLTKCQDDGCQCQRFFFFDGANVWCFNTEGADEVSEERIEWWDEPERNARCYRHLGCDEGDAPWVAPLDDCPPPTSPDRECARCCEVLPLAPREGSDHGRTIVPPDGGA